jgi:broad specificity phosphatase PhoE
VRLLLIRHAQSLGNAAHRIQGWDDQPLTELGRAQAAALARRLADGYDACALYSSPLLRARETAELVAGQLGLNIQCDDRLKEHDCGAITGMCFEEVANHFPEVARGWREDPWHTPIPGEESVGVFKRRVLSVFDEIVGSHSEGDTLAIIAHGGTLGAYLAGLLGLDFRQRQPWMFDNASLSIVILGSLRPRIALLNDTCHLHGSA